MFSVFKDFHAMMINQFGAKIKVFRSDNGIEYTNGPFSAYHHSKGIIHQTSCVGTPQQNGGGREKKNLSSPIVRQDFLLEDLLRLMKLIIKRPLHLSQR